MWSGIETKTKILSTVRTKHGMGLFPVFCKRLCLQNTPSEWLMYTYTPVNVATGGHYAAMCLCVVQDPIMPHEKRALNFLVHEYLMQRDNKLTAITFTEENGDQVRVEM